MKVLQIIPSLASGGAEHFVVDLSNQLKRMGVDVSIGVLGDTGPGSDFCRTFLDERIPVVSLQVKGYSFFHAICSVYKYVKSATPDVIHCHLSIIQYLVLVYVLFPKVKVVHTLHSVAKHASGRSKWHFKLFRFLYRWKVVQPVVISEMCYRSYVDCYGLRNAIVIENGIVPLRNTSFLDDVRLEVLSYKKNGTTPVFIHVARFHEAKNQKMLISVFNRLCVEGVDFCLLILGRGFDDGEGAILRATACGNIYFLGEKSNVGDYLKCADFFCLSSLYEGFPISLIEAMSLGVIPICTPVGGMVDAVVEGVTGYLSGDVSEASYYEALLRALRGHISKEKVVAYFDQNFKMDRCARRYLGVFEEI